MLITLYAWGRRYFPPEAPNIRLVDSESGIDVDPVLIDRSTGYPLDEEHTKFLPGPSADDRLRAALERRSMPAS